MTSAAEADPSRASVAPAPASLAPGLRVDPRTAGVSAGRPIAAKSNGVKLE